MNIVYKSEPERGVRWATWIAGRYPQANFRQWPDIGDGAAVDYLVAWQPPDNLMEHFPNLKVLFSVGAGADQFDYNILPADLPVVRMIEPGLTQGMVEYVTFAVLALHRDMPRYLQQQRAHQWLARAPLTADRRRVGVMGLGQLGEAVLQSLVALNFVCSGWSRSPRSLPGVRCFSGEHARAEFLAQCDILICLLPLTDQTRGILNAGLFTALPAGAALVQVGRGPQLNAQHLLAALASGQVSSAVIDVTDPEPLPADHPFWQHPAIWLTPHIASHTQPESAVAALMANIERHQRGEPMQGLIDRQKGY